MSTALDLGAEEVSIIVAGLNDPLFFPSSTYDQIRPFPVTTIRSMLPLCAASHPANRPLRTRPCSHGYSRFQVDHGEEEGEWVVACAVDHLGKMDSGLRSAEYNISSSGIVQRPLALVKVEDGEAWEEVEKFLQLLEDVQFPHPPPLRDPRPPAFEMLPAPDAQP